MKKESEDKTQDTKSFLRFDLFIAFLCGLLILACFISSFFPKSRLWGINHLAYFHLWVRLLFTILGLSILIPWFNSKIYNLLDKILTFLQSIFAKRKILGYTVLSMVFMFFFWLLRTRTHFYGDGSQAIYELESNKLFIKGSEPLEIISHLYLYKFLNLFLLPSAEFIYAGLSIFAGGVFILTLFFLTKTFSEDRFDRFFIFSILLFSGATELFLGYAEHYTLTYVSIFAYLYFSLRYLQGKVKIFLPILFCALSICFHLSCAYLLPSLFFLFILKKRKGEFVFIFKKAIPYILILIFLLGLFVFYVWSMNPNLLELFVPLFKERYYAPAYSLFSSSHLLDFINHNILLSPIGVVLLLSIIMIYKKRISFKDPIIVFLVIVSIAQVSYHFLIDPKLGAVRDWDLFSNVGLGYTLLGTYLFIKLIQSKRYSSLVLVFTALFSTLPWFLLNANTEKSIDRFKNLLDLDVKRSLSGRNSLAYYYSEHNRSIEDEKIKYEILELFPEDSLTSTAETYVNLGYYDKAMELLKKVLEINPRFARAHNALGMLYFNIGEVDKAIEEFQELVRFHQFNPPFNMNLGNALLRKGRLEEALKEFKKAEKFGAKEPDVYNNIAFIYFRLGDTKKALNNYNQALKISPNDHFTHFGLGLIYLESNSLDEALAEFERVVRVKPDYALAYYNLGVIYSRKGFKEKAIENYELFLKYSKDETQNEKVRGLIQQLRSQSP